MPTRQLTRVLLPELGEGVEQAEVVRILVSEEESITVDQPLLEIETDKCTVEVPAPCAGLVRKIHVQPGEVLKVGGTILQLEVAAAPRMSDDRPSNPGRSAIADPEEVGAHDVYSTVAASAADAENRIGGASRPSVDGLADANRGVDEPDARVPLRLLRIIEERLTAQEQRPTGPNKPADFLGPLAPAIKYDRCFVMMPYSEPWSAGVEAVLCECCTAAQFEFTIAHAMDGRFVPRDIWSGISGSGVVVADLTNANANVAYEVGLADAIGRDVILIAQESAVPFDFSGQRLILYKNSVAGALELRQRLCERLETIRKTLATRVNED